MKKINPTSILLVVAISSLLVIQGIYGYITKKLLVLLFMNLWI